jgi:ribosomal protein S18 acetylase RimI-like enzyme
MNVRIRQAQHGDAQLIVALIQELGASVGYPSPISEKFARLYLEFPGCHALLAEANGQAIGLLSYSIQPDLFHAANSCLIDELVVRASERDQGVGGALMSALLEEAAAAGCVEVSVSTMPENEGAQRFYRSYGLVDEAVFLEKHLGQEDG